MKTGEMQEFQNEFLEGYHFIPTALEKSSPGFLLRAGLSQAKPSYHIGPKLSPYFYLIFVLKGKGFLVQEKKVYSLAADDVFCLFPHITQEYYTLEEDPMLTAWIALDGNAVSQLLDRVGLTPESTYLPGAITPALKSWLEDFFTWCRSFSSPMTSDLARLGWFYGLFGLLEQKLPIETLGKGKQELWLKQASEYMRLHYAEGITAEQVAEYFGIDRTLFGKKFAAYFQIPPGRYLKNLKMEEAKRLLLGTSYEIAEIAQMVGYADLYSFSKEFKKSYGFPPSHCRPRLKATLTLPPASINKVIAVYGKMGEQWLQSLPRLIAYYESKWGLKAERLQLTYEHCFVTVKQKDGKEALLKLGIPGRETGMEIEALRLLSGAGTVRLIAAEAERGVLLIEKAVPGENLDTIDDERLTVKIAAEAIRALSKIWPDANHLPFDFDRTADWADMLYSLEERCTDGQGPLPLNLVQHCRRLLKELHAENSSFRLLHGNLHHEHIVESENGTWLAISPRGILAPPEFEAIPFLFHRLPKENQAKQLIRHAKWLAEDLNWGLAKLQSWCYCYAVWNAANCGEKQPDKRKEYIQIAEELLQCISA